MLTYAFQNRDVSFRTPTLICGSNNEIDGRIVVLRGADENDKIIKFHTDIRSKKIKLIKSNSRVSFLFYDKDEKIQLRIIGNAKINHQNEIAENSWKKTAHMSRKCYLIEDPPGTINQEPTSGLSEEIENFKYTLEESEIGYKNFVVVLTKITSIEWLFLAAKGHRRAKFECHDNSIKKYWLTP